MESLDQQQAESFYRSVVGILQENDIPFLIAGAFAIREYTGIVRDTKDFDLFVLQKDADRILKLSDQAGYHSRYVYPHWIAKVYLGDAFVDLIYRAGNGLCPITEEWFERARPGSAFGISAQLCPPEELIFMKAYLMDRGRFDGPDILHVIRSCGLSLDWLHLVHLFGEDWRILLSHLLVFQYVYPGETNKLPQPVMRDLLDRALAELAQEPVDERICRGPLLARNDYRIDVEEWGYKDGRSLGPLALNGEDIQLWSNGTE